MKRIYIVRHAKSSWADFSTPDHKRPLNDRGLRDAPNMAQWCSDHRYIPDVLITSHAKRARTTAEIFCKCFEKEKDILIVEESLYHAPAETYIEQLYGLSEEIQSVMLFGHNPGITYLANEIAREYIENVATCGILIVDSSAKTWAEVAYDNCSLLNYVAPKLI